MADPVIRFNQLITLPMVDMVERRRGAQGQPSRPTNHSKILDPHFEATAREWARSFAIDSTKRLLSAGKPHASTNPARCV
ncbi:hypothetical protein [Streptomyces sp. NPDC002851]